MARKTATKPIDIDAKNEASIATDASTAKTTTLEDILAAIESMPVVDRTATVDITAFTKRTADDPLVLTWRDPSLPKMYMIRPDAEKLMARNPSWNLSMAVDVATLAACHEAPTEKLAPGLLYEAIARTNEPLFLFLIGRLSQAFPGLRAGGNDTEALLDLCTQYFVRHPDEFKEAPAHILAGLQERASKQQSTSNMDA